MTQPFNSCEVEAECDMEAPSDGTCGHGDATHELADGTVACTPCLYAEYERADAQLGYIPGEDRCPTARRILENEAFLPDHEVRALITCHPSCRPR